MPQQCISNALASKGGCQLNACLLLTSHIHQHLNLTTVAPVLALGVVGRRNGDGSDVIGRGGRFVSVVVANLLLGDYSVDFGQDLLKCGFNICRIQSRCLDEREIISFCKSTKWS